MSTTHLAGAGVNFGGRGIQRCLICGLKLIDTKGMRQPTGDEPPCPWPEGAYVKQSPFPGGTQWSVLSERFPEHIPDDICLALVEE